MPSHLYLVLEAAAVDPQHNLGWAWPLLGLPDPEGRHNMQLSPLEQSGLISFHKETAAYEGGTRRLTSAASSAMPQTDFPKLQRSSGEEVTESGKGRGRGKSGQASNLEKWEREALLLVVPCVQRAQPSTLTPRSCVRRALAPLSTAAMLFLHRGGMNPAGRPLSFMAWSRASPSSFDGDKHGRMRQFCGAVAF